MSALKPMIRAAALILALMVPWGASAALINLDSGTVGDTSPIFSFSTGTLTLGGGVLADSGGGNLVYQSVGTNPITLTFSTGVDNLLLDVLNRDTPSLPEYFQLVSTFSSGNLVAIGNLQTNSVGLIEIGLTSADLYYSSFGAWDFTIDNVRFNIDLDCPEACAEVIPAPGGLPLMLAGLISLVLLRWRRRTPSSPSIAPAQAA